MKKTALIIASILFISFIHFSCEDNNLSDITDNVIGTMECSVNDTIWKAGAPVGTINSDRLIITGKQGVKNIAITFYTIATGDYNISVAEPGTLYISNIDSSSTNTYAAYQGNIKLTNLDTEKKKASGSFSFSAINPTNGDTVNVSNGSFQNVNYTN